MNLNSNSEKLKNNKKYNKYQKIKENKEKMNKTEYNNN